MKLKVFPPPSLFESFTAPCWFQAKARARCSSTSINCFNLSLPTYSKKRGELRCFQKGGGGAQPVPSLQPPGGAVIQRFMVLTQRSPNGLTLPHQKRSSLFSSRSSAELTGVSHAYEGLFSVPACNLFPLSFLLSASNYTSSASFSTISFFFFCRCVIFSVFARQPRSHSTGFVFSCLTLIHQKPTKRNISQRCRLLLCWC